MRFDVENLFKNPNISSSLGILTQLLRIKMEKASSQREKRLFSSNHI